jgi:hypothetical protein
MPSSHPGRAIMIKTNLFTIIVVIIGSAAAFGAFNRYVL